MNNNYNKRKNTDIYEIGQLIGLNKNDINSIINSTFSIIEQPSFSDGPIPYLSSLYGTINVDVIR